MKELDKMLSGNLYLAYDKELSELRFKCRELMDQINSTSFNDNEKRIEIIKTLFSKVGNNVSINKPFYCDYGINIEIGDNFYSNYDLLILDVNKVIIGNNVMFGPRVSIYTAAHPIDKDVRRTNLEYGLPVVIEDDVWIGGNTVINPGVTIGSGSVIGANAVVTKDIPSNVIAVGNPCRVLREITNLDKVYWEKEKDKYYNR